MPRMTEVITFSLPPEMAEQVRQLMEEEDRTMSGLMGERGYVNRCVNVIRRRPSQASCL